MGTISGATLSWAFFTVLPFQVAQGLSAGVALFFYKTFNVIFPPAAIIAVLIAQESLVNEPTRSENIFSLHDWSQTALFVMTPWLAGHCVLYLSAMVLSQLRKLVRRHMMRGQVAGLSEGVDRSMLTTTFRQFDTNCSGFLDAEELRIALRATRGEDVSVDECVEMIRSIDSDGDDLISLEEFLMIHDVLG